MTRKVTTLYIRHTVVNLLVMKGKQIEKWASLPLEPGLVSDGLILDEVQVAAKVKQLFRLAGVRTRKVVVGLSGADSLYRMITLPDLPDAILPEAVRREAGRVIPESFSEVYLSYQSIPAPTGERRVFLAAFPRNTTGALIRTLRKAGLKPHIMDLAPLALCRIPNEPRAIIVNARLGYITIMIMADTLPQVIRRLSLPTEAESLSGKLPTITEEISRTVAFYNSSHQENPLDSTVPVFVCGDLAEAAENWQSLADMLGYSVSPLPSPVKYPEGFIPNEFMVNIGLALKELPLERGEANFSSVNFNAMPEVYRPKDVALANILLPVGGVIGIASVAFMAFLVQNSMVHTEELGSRLTVAESAIARQREEIATLQEQIEEQMELQIKPMEAQLGPIEATAGVLEATLTGLEEGRHAINEDLSQIVNLLPAGVNLTAVSHGGDTITTSGAAQDEDDIFGYARALRGGGRFRMVVITSMAAHGEGEEKGFNFALLLK